MSKKLSTRYHNHTLFVNETVKEHPESAQYIMWDHARYCRVCDNRITAKDECADICNKCAEKDKTQ